MKIIRNSIIPCKGFAAINLFGVVFVRKAYGFEVNKQFCKDAYDKGFKYVVMRNTDYPQISVDNDPLQTKFTMESECFGVMTKEDARAYYDQGCTVFDCEVALGITKPQNKKNMGLTKETSLKIYNCYQQIDACDDFKKKVVAMIEQQKKKADESNDPIPANAYTRYGRGCQMGIPNGGSTASMSIFDISHELALLVIDEHRKKLVHDLEELQRIAVREQSADFSRNARLFKLLSDHRFQFNMKGVSSFYTYSEKELIGKLADEIGYTWVWACNIYDRAEAVKDEAIDRIVQTFETVSREWLADGTGEMFIKES